MFFFPPFFFRFCGSPVPGRQTCNLQQNSLLCLHPLAFSKYSHSSHASPFLIFSILYLFILKSSFVAAHTDLGKCGGRPSSLGQPRAYRELHFPYSLPQGHLPENRTNGEVPKDINIDPVLQTQTGPLRIQVLVDTGQGDFQTHGSPFCK